MNKKKFELWMTSIDEKYLEEAATPTNFKRNYRFIALAVAACLVLTATGLLFRHSLLPQNTTGDDGIIREQFTKNDTEYTLLSCEVAEPTDISGMEATASEPLGWYAGGLEIKLCSTNDAIWASWYDTNTKIQWCLLSDTTSLALLTTAKDIVTELGYNVAVAPEDATDITYDAFRINDLAVAETSFSQNGIRCHYRMAATSEISADFADISGTGNNYDAYTISEVGWCPAKLYYTENGSGKIIWFDIVPGLLYSLSMETNASEDALLALAHDLFVPAQDAPSW